ncbi:MAG: PIN domain-containing protein [Planctomycetaceae bacterium]|nr:PIN domain-containing protein [Planctomycetaceae bacterium]
MKTLVDANILLRVAQPGSSFHTVVVAALIRLNDAGNELCLVPQVIYEYWVVVTRPVSGNGLGLTAADADGHIQDLLSRFTLLRDERGIFSHWYQLVVRHSVHGKLAHDARLVAAMQRHGLTRILTFNTADFSRFTSIEALSPDGVVE